MEFFEAMTMCIVACTMIIAASFYANLFIFHRK